MHAFWFILKELPNIFLFLFKTKKEKIFFSFLINVCFARFAINLIQGGTIGIMVPKFVVIFFLPHIFYAALNLGFIWENRNVFNIQFVNELHVLPFMNNFAVFGSKRGYNGKILQNLLYSLPFFYFHSTIFINKVCTNKEQTFGFGLENKNKNLRRHCQRLKMSLNVLRFKMF